jgi:hypothetical protein
VVGPGGIQYQCIAVSRDGKFVLAGGAGNHPPSPSPIVKVTLDDGTLAPIPLQSAKHVTHLFLCDRDSKVAYVDAGDRGIHVADLATGSETNQSALFLDGVPQPSQNKSVVTTHALAVAPDGNHIAVSTGVSDFKYQFSVLDPRGSRRLIRERDPVQSGQHAIPNFSDANTLEMLLPTGQARRWTYSVENEVWLEQGTRSIPAFPSHPFFRPFMTDGKILWFGLDKLLVGLDSHTGRTIGAIVFKSSDGYSGNPIEWILGVSPIPNANKVAVAMADGRVAVAEY